MLFNFNFYSAFLLIFVSNGFLYSFLLFKKGLENQLRSYKWLSFFVLLCSLYISPWMLGFAGWYDNQPFRDIIFYVPFQHLFFLGPLIYFYVQSLLNPNFKLNRKNVFHLIPGFCYLLYSLVIVVTDKLLLKKYYFLADGTDREFDEWYQTSGLISMVIYFVLSFLYYQKYLKLINHLVSNADELRFKWIKKFLIAFLSMQILQVVFSLIFALIPAASGYDGSWWYYFSFALVMYYIAISGYSNRWLATIPFEFDSFQNNKVYLLGAKNSEVVEEIDFEEIQYDKTPNEDNERWKIKILDLFENECLSQNAELSLNDVAKKLQTNVSVISKTINQSFNLNFNDFVNQYRVNQIKKAIENGEHKKTTLLGLAYDSGFNSKATFNRAFKKTTGSSPKAYIQNLK